MTPWMWRAKARTLLASLLLVPPACGPSTPALSGQPPPGAVPVAAPEGAHDGSPSGDPATSSNSAQPEARQASGRPHLSDVLTRDPREDSRCTAPFPSFWTWERQAADADMEALKRVIWLEPNRASEPPVVAEHDSRAVDARCIAVGPHRGLNLANWCCRAGATARTVPPPAGATGLVATLAVERSVVKTDRELVVAVAIENRGPNTLELDLLVASAPVLLLEVRNASGARVPTIPPPTPPVQRQVLPLPRGGGRTFQHRLGVFSPPLPPGSCRNARRSFHYLRRSKAPKGPPQPRPEPAKADKSRRYDSQPRLVSAHGHP